MIKALLLFLVGWASAYSPGVMHHTIVARQGGLTAYSLPAELPLVAGYAAVQDCSQIGNIFYLKPEGGSWERFLATDCGGGADGGAHWMRTNNILVEVDHQTWSRWNRKELGNKVQMTYEELFPLEWFGRIR